MARTGSSPALDPALDPRARAQARVGRVLCGKWSLDRVIDVGGMASVYAATHRNGRRVAIKMLHAQFAREETIRTRFLREGYLANKIDHLGAVAVIDDDIAEGDSPFLVMELLEGESLESRFSREIERVPELLLIADQVLDVLAVAHAKGVVHRDIKPANVFLTHDGVVKVLDFGLARVRELNATSLTRAGMVIGTPSYMPPEQARARWDLVDDRSDLWSLGATMFRGLSGRTVHLGADLNERLIAAMTHHAPSIGEIVPDLPQPVIELVDTALRFQKVERFTDARAMQERVREVYQLVEKRELSRSVALSTSVDSDSIETLPEQSVGELAISVEFEAIEDDCDRVAIKAPGRAVTFELRQSRPPRTAGDVAEASASSIKTLEAVVPNAEDIGPSPITPSMIEVIEPRSRTKGGPSR
jgi:serine/threonine protein kinase